MRPSMLRKASRNGSCKLSARAVKPTAARAHQQGISEYLAQAVNARLAAG